MQPGALVAAVAARRRRTRRGDEPFRNRSPLRQSSTRPHSPQLETSALCQSHHIHHLQRECRNCPTFGPLPYAVVGILVRIRHQGHGCVQCEKEVATSMGNTLPDTGGEKMARWLAQQAGDVISIRKSRGNKIIVHPRARLDRTDQLSI